MRVDGIGTDADSALFEPDAGVYADSKLALSSTTVVRRCQRR